MNNIGSSVGDGCHTLFWNDKWVGPHRMKFHLWKVAHDRFLTNVHRSKWYNSSPSCSHCTFSLGSSLHALRECPLATRAITSSLAKVMRTSSSINISWSFPPYGWVKVNVDEASKGNHGPEWCGGILLDSSGQWGI
ncbi:hypothetical protein RIF29_03793 [Crotalaria pallida]|uniref:Reverse transcriptase zinc-binding domain-containing protein n=1 Tax=Crotalaria pallida TaxID=3830 RepID=A0AAN9J1N5_CROPI